MAFAAFLYALNGGGGNAIWLVLLHDAGHNILGIPWWVWVVGGAVLVAAAIFAGPELLVAFAPEILPSLAEAAAEEAAAGAGDAAFNASMAAQGFEGVTADALDGAMAIQDGELGDAVGNALQEGLQASREAWGQAYAQSMAEQAEAAAAQALQALNNAKLIAAAAGPAATFLGATEIPDVVSDVAGQVKQVGSAVQEVGTEVGDMLGSSSADPAPNTGVNAGDPG